jgi:tRNA threonylcarbamoyladenosine biosynthesis protein TsaB
VIVLALDTSARSASCAILNGQAMREEAAEGSQSHEVLLPGALMQLLEHAALTLADVDVFAVSTGPGSFTGLRVGIATMQGLAFAGGKPLVGVSAFDALAVIAEAQTRGSPMRPARPVATWIDAWRGEVFAALYDRGHQLETPTVEPPSVVLDRIREYRPLFIGDAVPLHVHLIRERVPGAELADPAAPALAGTIARLAARAADSGYRPQPDAITPLYVRRTDAEIARDARTRR